GAPGDGLGGPEATAASWSARSIGICSLAAISKPSADTRTACETPDTSRANLATSQSSESRCVERGGFSDPPVAPGLWGVAPSLSPGLRPGAQPAGVIRYRF